MDDETRFWIARSVADKKKTSDVQPLFKHGKEVADKKRNVLISDSPTNFHVAYKKELFNLKSPRTKHIKHIRFKGDDNKNGEFQREGQR